MDKNTIIGMLLMAAVLFGFMYVNTPSQEELQQQQQATQQAKVEKQQPQQHVLDSLTADEVALLKQNLRDFGGDSAQLSATGVQVALSGDKLSGNIEVEGKKVAVGDVLDAKIADIKLNNQAIGALRKLNETYSLNGQFASKMRGSNQVVKLKNDSLELEISSKGGMISRATLLGYKSAHLTKKVEVFSPGENVYSFILNTNARRYDTKDYYFTPRQLNDSTVEMDLDLGAGSMFGIRYTLASGGNYMVRMEIVQRGMNKVIESTIPNMDFYWHQKMSRHEEGKMFEERNSTIYYKYAGGDVDYLNEAGEKEENMQDRMKWISTKNQFFSAVFIPDGAFMGAQLKSVPFGKESPDYEHYLKDLTVHSTLDYKSTSPNPASFFLYLGPNRYRLLNNYADMMAKYPTAKVAKDKDEDLELTRLISMGWAFFRLINTYVVLPVFNWLGSFIGSYGIIILLLTIFIKLILFPFTVKSLKSQAKMRILAPDIKAINDKYPGQENAIKRQQKTMELYNQAGASPLGGCLPMLLTMPIYIAVFAFFPSCIELRGQSFLWAADLSAPDAIYSWTTQIPIISSYFGNHISLFCLLMTVTNIAYTYLTMQSQSSSNQMPGMKWMMYLMPVFFLVFFNNYASGLSYYYFISLLLTIIQTYACRAMVKEADVRARMAENAKKPKKKSGFMARLEEAQRQQQAALREQSKQGKKRR